MPTACWCAPFRSPSPPSAFDTYRGYYHQPRYGRPALALDMMEPFRALIADSSAIQAINNGEVRPTDFICAAGSVALTADGRKRFIAAYGHDR